MGSCGGLGEGPCSLPARGCLASWCNSVTPSSLGWAPPLSMNGPEPRGTPSESIPTGATSFRSRRTLFALISYRTGMMRSCCRATITYYGACTCGLCDIEQLVRECVLAIWYMILSHDIDGSVELIARCSPSAMILACTTYKYTPRILRCPIWCLLLLAVSAALAAAATTSAAVRPTVV